MGFYPHLKSSASLEERAQAAMLLLPLAPHLNWLTRGMGSSEIEVRFEDPGFSIAPVEGLGIRVAAPTLVGAALAFVKLVEATLREHLEEGRRLLGYLKHSYPSGKA